MGRVRQETVVFCYEPITKLFAPFSLNFFLNNIVSLFKAATLGFTYFLLYFYFENLALLIYHFFLGFGTGLHVAQAGSALAL